MRLRLTTLGCCGALGLVLASRVGLLRHLFIKVQVLVTMRIRLLRLGSESLETWVRTQLQLHALLDLEVNRRLADGRVPVPAVQSRLELLCFGVQPDPKLMANPMDMTPVVKDLVLVGGGHSHVHVLKMFGMRAEPGVRLTLITRDVETPYSGMLPGYVAGMYTREECHIDLPRLATFANARLIHAEACGIDVAQRRVLLKGRPPVAYDVLSIDIGSAPQPVPSQPADGAGAAGGGTAPLASITPVKPIDGFCARWDVIVRRVQQQQTPGSAPVRLVVVGGGAGGVELALAVQARLASRPGSTASSEVGVQVSLVSRNAQVMPQHSPGVRAIFERVLRERGVTLLAGKEVALALNPNPLNPNPLNPSPLALTLAPNPLALTL